MKKLILISSLLAAGTLGAWATNHESWLSGGSETLTTSADYDSYILYNGTSNIALDENAPTTPVVISVGNFLGVNNNKGATTLNIGTGTTFTVTGTTTSCDAKIASFMLANYGSTGTVTVSGTLNLSSGLSVRDGTGVFTVKSGGVANLQAGLIIAAGSNGISVTLEDGGRMNIGSAGIASDGNTTGIEKGTNSEGQPEDYRANAMTLTFGAGSVGVLVAKDVTDYSTAGWSSAHNMTLTGTKFDTQIYKMAEDGNSSAAVTGEFGKISLSGTLTGSFSVVGTGTVDLSGATLLLTEAIENEGTIVVSGTTTINLTSALATSDNVYKVIDGGTITGWDNSTLSTSNFTLNGLDLSTTRLTVSIGSDGEVTVGGSVYELYWKTSADFSNNAWYHNSATGPDTAMFKNGDNLHFVGGVTASLAPSKSFAIGTIEVSGNSTLSITNQGNLTWTEANVASGSTISFLSVGNSFTKKITGAGTVKIACGTGTEAYGRTYDIGDDFMGTVEISGDFQITGTNIGQGTLKVLGNLQVKSAATDTFANNIVFGDGTTTSTHQLHTNGSASLTLSGDVTISKNATLNKHVNGGTLAFNGGNITIAGNLGFGANSGGNINITVASGKTLNASGNVNISTLTVDGGAANFTGGTSDLGTKVSLLHGATMTISGGVIEADQIQVHNDGDNNNDVLNISGGVLNLTATGDQTNSALVIAHYPGASYGRANHGTVNVSGTGVLNVLAGQIQISWDCGGTLNITGGEVNAKTISMAYSGRVDRPTTLSVAGGRLNLGSGGLIGSYNSSSSNLTVEVNGGTLGALDNWSTSLNMTVGANGATFDTQQREAVSDGASTQSDTGATITVSGVVSGDGGLTKEGLGTLVLSGANTYAGKTNIKAGTLKVTNSQALGTQGNVIIQSGATLLIAVDGGLSIGQSGTSAGVVFSEGAKFAIDLSAYNNVVEDSALTIITASSIANSSVLPIDSLDFESYFDADASALTGFEELNRVWEYSNGVLQLTFTSAIPEPSMFGLLAGTLALALAGTRRRRRGNVK